MIGTPPLPFEVTPELAGLAAWFAQYDRDNPEIWRAFERLTLQMVASGHRLGAKAVSERIRWEILVDKGKDGFRVNNNAVAFYARKFHAAHPELGAVFQTRVQGGAA